MKRRSNRTEKLAGHTERFGRHTERFAKRTKGVAKSTQGVAKNTGSTALLERIGSRIDSIPNLGERLPPGSPGRGSLRHLWPFFLAGILPVIMLDIAWYAIREIRRNVYNRNRNRKYVAKGKFTTRRKWRPEAPSRNGSPLPPDFTDSLCSQWNKVHDSLEEMLKFGNMMIELEKYVDNSYIFNHEGRIIARNPGIRGFLALHCPHIGYKTAMRYRILAMKAQVVVRKQGTLNDVRKECKKQTLHELGEKFDAHLNLEHRLQEYRARRRHRCNCNPIFDIREQARAAIAQLDDLRRQRLATALQELAREVT